MHLVQQSPEWHTFRDKHIGSSDIAAIVGLSPWKTLYELWQEKTGRKQPDEANYAMQRGLAMEEEARDAYTKQTSNSVMPTVLTLEKHEFCMASLDGVTYDGKKIVEIKCPLSDKTLNLAQVGQIEDHYLCQVQWQLLISKAESCDFWVYTKKESALVEVKADNEMQKNLLEAAIAFWDFVVNDIEPEKPENAPIMITAPEFQSAAEKYKKAYQENEKTKKTLSMAKEELLDATDGGSCFGFGITVTRIDESKCVDWDAVKLNFNLTDEKLAPYTKLKAPFFRVSILKDKES